MAARHSNDNARIPAVAYYRMSTDKQDASIPAQRTEVERYAAANGYRIIREYIDAGISGDATEKRKQFQKLRDDATKIGDFRAILCWDTDRFGRFNSIEAGFWIHPLMQAGVKLVTVAHGVVKWDDFSGRLMFSIQQEGKHQFLRDLSRNVARGMLNRAKDGKRNGAKAPFGYVTVDKTLCVADDEKPDVVRRILTEYCNGVSLCGIAKKLNREGVPSPKGSVWKNPSIRSMIKNPAYCGRLVWNRASRGKYHNVATTGIVDTRTPDGKIAFNAIDEWIEDVCPAIISREVWERANAELNRKRLHIKRPRDKYVLSSTIVCGHCGNTMDGCTFVRGRGADRAHQRMYRCRGGSHGYCDCKTYMIAENVLVAAVAKKLAAFIGTGSNLKRLEAAITRKAESLNLGVPKQAAKLEREIKAIGDKIATGTDRLLEVPASVVKELSAKVATMQQRRDELEAELAALRRSGADVDGATVARSAIAELRNIGRLLRGDTDASKAALRRCIGEVKLWFESYTPGGKRVCFRPLRGEIKLRNPTQHLSNATVCRRASSALP